MLGSIIILFSIYIIADGLYYIILLSGPVTGSKFGLLILIANLFAKIMVLLGLIAINRAIINCKKIDSDYIFIDNNENAAADINQFKGENTDLND